MNKILILLALGGALIFFISQKESSSVTDETPIVPMPAPAPMVTSSNKKSKKKTSTLSASEKLAASNKRLVEAIVKVLRTNVVAYNRKNGRDFSADKRAEWILSSMIKNRKRLAEVKAMYFNTYQSKLMDDLRRPLTMTIYNKYKNL